MRRAAALVLLLTVVTGCSVLRQRPEPPPVVGGVQVGLASWYGPGFDGRPTANGERYDQWRLTAAHPSLPFGTRVMVTSLDNGRAVELRINDRGPFVEGRIIDVSRAAAHHLHMIGPGTMQVRVEVLDAPIPLAPDAITADPAVAPYVVQVGTFSRQASAERLRDELAGRFPNAHVTEYETDWDRYFRVRVGPFAGRALAEERAQLVARLGYPALVLRANRP